MKLNKIIYNVDTNKPVEIDLEKIVKGRALFQANSGGGKSYLLRKFLEESHNKIQQIILDSEGEYPTLREKFDYLLVGKDDADIQVDTRHAELLAKKLMETGNSAIIDLFELPPSQRKEFVQIFVQTLVDMPKKFWHPCLIVIDEIHIYAPEGMKKQNYDCLEAVSSLASRGRKRGYALIGATQKLSKFNKEVAAELNTKFTGRCTLDIDQKRAAAELGIKDHTMMRDLDNEFFLFGPGIDGTIKVKSYEVKTTHEEIGTDAKIQLGNPSKIKSMMKDFSELPQEAENELKTHTDLRKKITEQTIEISKLSRQQPTQDPQSIQNAYVRGVNETTLKFKEQFKSVEIYHKRLTQRVQEIKTQADKIIQSATLIDALDFKLNQTNEGDNRIVKEIIAEKLVTHEVEASVDHGDLQTVSEFPATNGLNKCENALLMAIKQRGTTASRKQISIISGYSIKSSGFKNSIGSLKSGGLMVQEGEDFRLTAAGGVEMTGVEIIIKTPEEIQKFWIGKLGKCSAILLKIICETNPSWITKSLLAEKSKYSENSSGFKNSIGELVSLQLVERGHDGMFRATDEMFPY